MSNRNLLGQRGLVFPVKRNTHTRTHTHLTVSLHPREPLMLLRFSWTEVPSNGRLWSIANADCCRVAETGPPLNLWQSCGINTTTCWSQHTDRSSACILYCPPPRLSLSPSPLPPLSSPTSYLFTWWKSLKHTLPQRWSIRPHLGYNHLRWPWSAFHIIPPGVHNELARFAVTPLAAGEGQSNRLPSLLPRAS